MVSQSSWACSVLLSSSSRYSTARCRAAASVDADNFIFNSRNQPMPLTQIDNVAALVVIDMQKGLVALPTVHPFPEIAERVARLAHALRKHGLPVVLVNVAGGAPGRVDAKFDFSPPADWTDLIPELDQRPSDHTVTKLQIGAFY